MIFTSTDSGYDLCVPRCVNGYLIQRQIANGSTCVVFEAADCNSGKVFALKVMSKSDLMEKGLIPKIEREISVLKSVDHANICHFIEVFEQDGLIFLVLEYCPGEDLLQFVLSGRLRDILAVKRLFLQICTAVKYLHDRGIAHGDLKPENVVVSDNGLVKLTDFGYCHVSEFAGNDDKSGTLFYAAPELFVEGEFVPKRADIWSLGVMLFTMATSQFPFPDGDDTATMRHILRGNLLYPRGMNPEVKAVVRKLLQVDPYRRPTIDELIADPFLREATWVIPKQPQVTANADGSGYFGASIDENLEWNVESVLVA